MLPGASGALPVRLRALPVRLIFASGALPVCVQCGSAADAHFFCASGALPVRFRWKRSGSAAEAHIFFALPVRFPRKRSGSAAEAHIFCALPVRFPPEAQRKRRGRAADAHAAAFFFMCVFMHMWKLANTFTMLTAARFEFIVIGRRACTVPFWFKPIG